MVNIKYLVTQRKGRISTYTHVTHAYKTHTHTHTYTHTKTYKHTQTHTHTHTDTHTHTHLHKNIHKHALLSEFVCFGYMIPIWGIGI